MSIVGAFMVPHPPIILPEVGKGEEEKIRETTDSYVKVAEEIAALAPETIIITSPHSIMYSDYFHISPGETAYGDMSRFNADEVSFSEKYDTELVGKICEIADSRTGAGEFGFPAGTLGERDKALDHGTMIPLYFIRKKYSDFKLVRTGLSGLSYPTHYEFGKILQEAVEQTGRRVVLVASGDLSHKMKEEGPYGFAKEGPEYDERIMEVCGSGRFDELLDFDEDFCDKAAECGHRSFIIMAGALDGMAIKPHRLSHQATFGVGYGICTYDIEGIADNRHFLDSWRQKKMEQIHFEQNQEGPYVKLARYSLESYIITGKRLSLKDIDTPEWSFLPKEMFEQKAGAFVSIHKNGALRGCIGTILPTCGCVAEEILQNAISASTNDPRFKPIRESEFDQLEISVDVLNEPEPIASRQELDVKKYGVIVTAGRKRGLLLPNLDGVDSVDQQIVIACQKAGISENEQFTMERFEVIRHY